MLLVHLFVYFARVIFCSFSLPVGVRGWLRLVIVTLPRLFFCCFCFSLVKACLFILCVCFIMFPYV